MQNREVDAVIKNTRPLPHLAMHNNLRVGYAFHGFLADVRTKNGLPYSAPDGNYFYSWTILQEFLHRGWKTYSLFPDRDAAYTQFAHEKAFQCFSQEKRVAAYANTLHVQHTISTEKIQCQWPELDLVLVEWRMPTTRNTLPMNHPDFEPDLLLQQLLIDHYTHTKTPIICIDLDYAMNPSVDDKLFTYVFEFGFKRGHDHHVDFPFDMSEIRQFEMKLPHQCIAYVGNRYHRDDAFQQFFGTGTEKLSYEVYGNWLEGEKDSAIRWPHIHFHPRAQPYHIRFAYEHATCVPLLLKEAYNLHGFMTPRHLEALLFGTIPVLPQTFTSQINYPLLRVKDEAHMARLAETLLSDVIAREAIRDVIIDGLQFHDVTHFVDKILSVF